MKRESKEKKICVVVVTFNRKELLVQNISSLLKQNYPIDILIYDNHSTDGTEEYLNKANIIEMENVYYYYADSNYGGAGGFSYGLQIAYKMGYGLFWLMDDDGHCVNERTLEKLIDKLPNDRNDYILNSTVICDEKSLKLTFGFLDILTYEQLLEEATDGIYDGYINPFNGTLISRGCVDKIGFPKAEFFLYGDEHEYMLRALKNNILIQTVTDSLYFHPINRTIEYKKLFHFLIPVKDEPAWKTFCDVRNTISISREYESKKMTHYRIFIFLCAALLKKNKIQSIRSTLLGILDGTRNNFTRQFMKK